MVTNKKKSQRQTKEIMDWWNTSRSEETRNNGMGGEYRKL